LASDSTDNVPVRKEDHMPGRRTRSRKKSSDAVMPKQFVQTRQKTPTPIPSIDSDLYGLSPGGEVSRSRIEANAAAKSGSQRTSLSRPPSALRGRGTPGIDSSVLALNNFKRRARKPSIIRINTAQNSEVEDNTEDFSLPLGSDDFAPVDESTPLNVKKRRMAAGKSTSALDTPASSSARKRKFDETQLDGERTRTAMSSAPLSSPPPVSSDDDRLPNQQIFPSIETNDVEDRLSDTMAPPLSSSSAQLSPLHSDIEAMNEGISRKRLKAVQPSSLQLEKFLPKIRRNQRPSRAAKNVLDIPDSSELSSVDLPSPSPISERGNDTFMGRRGRSTRVKASVSKKLPTKSPAKKPGVLTESKSKSNARLGRQARDVNHAQSTPNLKSKSGTTPLKKSSRRRTYGNRNKPDQENDEDVSFRLEEQDESTLSVLQENRDKALSQMKNKFAEVDDWEMEFETVDY
jgi:hypothetical protein